jgi:hypothetical protein
MTAAASAPRLILRAFLARHGITAEAFLVDQRPDSLMADMPAGSRHWRVVLKRWEPDNYTPHRRQLTVYFSQGPAIEQELTAEDVLDCLASDWAGWDQAHNFGEWCMDYGYDTDSRKAEAIWRELGRQAAQLERFLGAALVRELAYNTERPDCEGTGWRIDFAALRAANLPAGYHVDVCTCRHARSVHADRFAPGHGQCVQAGCRCSQFTWAGRLEVAR